ncbi:MAG: glycoside hydrolase family 30 beta sandwich domain-containing protein [Saprospiraceae bacterium]
MKINSGMYICLVALLVLGFFGCNKNNDVNTPAELPVQNWVTSANGINLLYNNKGFDFATAKDNRYPVIEINATETFQTIEGFGFSLTGGSAMLLHQMGASERAALLQEFFGNGNNSIHVSYLRISIGASDLDPVVFSYDDLPSGVTDDPQLQRFSLARDTLYLIPVLKEILSINPEIKIMGSPWSAPTWMKSNKSSIGGNLKTQYYNTYADYFVKYIQAMKSHGITIDAVTPQNEPQHGGNNPSLVMSSINERDFVKDYLGPAFHAAGITTKIIIWDHNCDNPDYPISILNDPAAKAFVDGSAFHLYGGDVSALSAVHDAHPDKDLYFTEQWTGSNETFSENLKWHMKNVIIGTMRNWSSIALEWNLANDPTYNPHTPGGCSQCKGAVTIDGSTGTKNVSYYIIGQAAKFIPPGSVRIGSNVPGTLYNVAFLTPEGKNVLIVLNESANLQTFNINAGDRWITASLHAETVGTFIW